MSHSDSEEKAREIVEFLAKTWKIIATVIIVGLLAIWGWRYWQSHQTQNMITTSDKYELLTAKVNASDPKSVDDLVQFAQDNSNIYGVLADLKAAQFYVNTLKDYAGAEQLLIAASKKTDSEPVIAIINIRIAKLQYQLGQYQDGLNSLDKVTGESWGSIANDIRGDILAKMNKYQEACNAYEVALASNPSSAFAQSIQMKLNNTEFLAQQQLSEKDKLTGNPINKETQEAVDKPIVTESLTQQ